MNVFFCLFQSEESLTEFMELIDGLRSSLLSLKEREELESSSLCALCNTCLIHTYVYVRKLEQHFKPGSFYYNLSDVNFARF